MLHITKLCIFCDSSFQYIFGIVFFVLFRSWEVALTLVADFLMAQGSFSRQTTKQLLLDPTKIPERWKDAPAERSKRWMSEPFSGRSLVNENRHSENMTHPVLKHVRYIRNISQFSPKLICVGVACLNLDQSPTLMHSTKCPCWSKEGVEGGNLQPGLEKIQMFFVAELASGNLNCQWNCSLNLFPKSRCISHFLQEPIFWYFWGFGTQGFHQDVRLLGRKGQAMNSELDPICLKIQDCSDVEVLVRHSFNNSNGTPLI